MRKICLFLGFLFCFSLFSQNKTFIKGVILDENGYPLKSANISLSVSNKILEQTSSLNDGSFIISSLINEKNIISISHIGYIPQSFLFSNLKDTVDIGNISMTPDTTVLEEVTIKAKPVIITNKGRIYYPSSKKAEMVGDGLSLLAMLNLPQISIIPGTKVLKYWGKGNIMFYINEVEANISQVQAIPSRIISKVEYINRPNIEYGHETGVVIKIFTKKYDRGLYNSISIEKPINRSTGSFDLESRFNYKKSEVAININSSYTNSKKHFDENQNKESFFLENETIFRDERQIRGLLKENYHNFSITYVYNINKGKLSIKGIYNRENTPHDIQESTYTYNQIKKDNHKILFLNKNKNTIKAVIDYRLPINKKDLFSANVFYYYLNHTGHREYEEKNESLTSFFNSYTKGFSQGVRFRGVYVKSISPRWTIQNSLSNYYTYFSNTYNGVSNDISKIERNTLSYSTGFIYKIDNFESMFLLNFGYNCTKLDKKKTHRVFEPKVSVDLSYLLNSKGTINCNLGLKSLRPAPEDLSAATQVIDNIQIRKGNPNLKNGYALNTDLGMSIDFNIIELNVYSNSEIAYNAIQEHTFLDNDNNKIIRMANNYKYVIALKNGLELSTHRFNFMRASLGIGYNWFKSKTDFGKTYYYGKPWLRTSVDFYLKKWIFNCSLWTHNNDFYGEVLETSGRMISFVLSRTWLNGKLSTSLKYDNPIMKNYAKQGVINKSVIAPYENWTFSKYSNNMITLNLSYKFNIGRKSKTPKNIETPSIYDGQISSKKSAEIK